MWLKKKILVATDFGELSEAICEAGLQMAQRFHVPLVVMHTYVPPSPTYTGVPILRPGEYRELVENAARATLDQEAAPLRGKGVEVQQRPPRGCRFRADSASRESARRRLDRDRYAWASRPSASPARECGGKSGETVARACAHDS